MKPAKLSLEKREIINALLVGSNVTVDELFHSFELPAAHPDSRQMLRACQCFILQLIHTFRFSNRLSSAVIPHSRSSFVLLFP